MFGSLQELSGCGGDRLDGEAGCCGWRLSVWHSLTSSLARELNDCISSSSNDCCCTFSSSLIAGRVASRRERGVRKLLLPRRSSTGSLFTASDGKDKDGMASSGGRRRPSIGMRVVGAG